MIYSLARNESPEIALPTRNDGSKIFRLAGNDIPCQRVMKVEDILPGRQ
jgi:hypothetical protein